MKQTIATLLIAACIVAGGSALADGIYKYVDANGVVHYVDRPTNSPTEERVEIQAQYREAGSAGDGGNSGPDWRERRAARNEAKDEADAAREEAEERARECQEQRDKLEQYSSARRLYRTNAEGERVYLDEAQIAEAVSKVRERINEYCDS